MLLRTSALRRILAQEGKRWGQNRAFHNTCLSSADALDMVDTFRRRHCEFCSFFIIAIFTREWNVTVDINMFIFLWVECETPVGGHGDVGEKDEEEKLVTRGGCVWYSVLSDIFECRA